MRPLFYLLLSYLSESYLRMVAELMLDYAPNQQRKNWWIITTPLLLYSRDCEMQSLFYFIGGYQYGI